MEKTDLLGANLLPGGCEFRIWAPKAQRLRIRPATGAADIELAKDEEGYFSGAAPLGACDRYFCIVDEQQPVPDPVSRFLPEGVHGPTEIIDPNAFAWTDRAWKGLELGDYILYELHIGAFTSEGTLDSAISRLDDLKSLGVTAIEVMPVAAVPHDADGTRNWGYDGVQLYAVERAYGGPGAFKRFVNAAHERGLAVVLDVVYNHLGNEGNYLRQFGPYFTDRFNTPWGEAVNFAESCVREYFIQNALYWVRESHIDGLRLDAVHTFKDDSSLHILAELQARIQELARGLGRHVCVIAESDENDSRIVRPRSEGGYGLDGFWSDDFHHAVHALLTAERNGYYQDFGSLEAVATALHDGYVFQGQQFKFWGRERGTSAQDVPLAANIFCLQNHDQIGNRAKGERLHHLIKSAARLKAAAALLLLSPATPLLFMGEEWNEPSPFQFFTSYGDPALVEAVRSGRKEEFKSFNFGDDVPDPQSPGTFERSKLHWELSTEDNDTLRWYRGLIKLRKQHVTHSERRARVSVQESVLRMQIADLEVAVNFAGRYLPPMQGECLMSDADEGAAVSVHRL